MTRDDPLARIVTLLQGAGIPFMLTGSFASAYHGQPRATQDIDLVIAPDEVALRAFVGALQPDQYYVDLDAALEALRAAGQFNVIDLATGWKIDLLIRKERAFSQEEFERRRPVRLQDVEIDIVTVEDLIVAKLEWAKVGGSSRQLEDVASIIALRGDSLDLMHIARWVAELGLGSEWSAALERSRQH